MRDTNKVSDSAARLITKVSTWCLKNNDDNFSCFFEYSAHVGTAEVAIYPVGWSNDQDNIHHYNFDIAGRNYREEDLKDNIDEFMVDCRRMKKESK